MPNILFRLLLFLSSYFPLALILFVLFLKKHPGPATAVLILGVAGALGLYAYLRSLRNVAPLDVQIESVQRRDGEAMSYIMTYVIPFLAIPFGDWEQGIALSIFFAVLAILYVNSDMIHVNPMLNLAGYHLYEITDNKGSALAYLSKNRPRRGESVTIVRIGQDIVVEK